MNDQEEHEAAPAQELAQLIARQIHSNGLKIAAVSDDGLTGHCFHFNLHSPNGAIGRYDTYSFKITIETSANPDAYKLKPRLVVSDE